MDAADDSSSVSSGGDENKERGNWTHKLDFVLACVGYAVGLGNLWRFPYLCMRNGGGAFLVPYFLFMLLCGIPLFFLEMALGQFASLSPLSVWKLSPLFKGLGYGSMLVTALCTLYYNMIIAWVLYYLGHSFTHSLPWADCKNDWNTPDCMQRGGQALTVNFTSNLTHVFDTENSQENGTDIYNINTSQTFNLSQVLTAVKKTTPSEEFWQFQMLELSSGIHETGGIRWQLLLCLTAAWFLVFCCLCKGVKSTGKVVYVTATLPYIFLTILLVRGLLLPGSLDGIKFYIIPDWSRLGDINVWVEACLQVFFSMGVAWGTLITMASYNRFQNNCLRDAIIVPCVNCGTSFYAGFVIFSVIGFMAKEAGLPVKDVVTSGPGLAFIAYPEAITKLPFAPFWAVMFFLMLLTLGLDTQFGMVETITSGIVDSYPRKLGKRKVLVTGVTCLVFLLIGLPLTTKAGMYVFQLIDWYCAAFTILLIGVLECVVMAYVYGVNRFCYDIKMMIGQMPGLWWKMCWCAITPGIMLVMFIITLTKVRVPTYGDYVFPTWSVVIGWMVALVSAIPIPAFAILEMVKAKGTITERFMTVIRPEEDWGPALPKHRAGYKYAAENQNRDLHKDEQKYMLGTSSV